MKNLKVRMKLFISFAGVLVFFLISIFVGVINLAEISAEIDEYHTGAFFVNSRSLRMTTLFEGSSKELYSALLYDTDAAVVEASLANVQAMNLEMQDHLAFLNERFTAEPQLLDTLEAQLVELAEYQAIAVEMVLSASHDDAVAYMSDVYTPASNAANATMLQIVAAAVEESEIMIDAIDAVAETTTYILIGLGVGSLILSVLMFIVLTNNITRPLVQLETAANSLAAGDFDVTIDYTSKDEFGRVADAMRAQCDTIKTVFTDFRMGLSEMSKGNLTAKSGLPEEAFPGEFMNMRVDMYNLLNSLIDAMGGIRDSAGQVTMGSEQVASGAQALAQGSTEQASSVEELSATIAELATSTDQNASSSKEITGFIRTTADHIQECNVQMDELTGAIGDIKVSAQSISQIIKTIEDIAFQTNILALNAAVEAARAGEAGKGFAVVADEVRNLASKSGEAANNTNQLINGAIQSVDRGSELADATAESLKLVVDSAEQIATSMAQINDVTAQQAMSLDQINEGIGQISSVVQANSATAEESAAVSEEISSQANFLNQLVSRFRLPGAAESPAAPAAPALPSPQMIAPTFEVGSNEPIF